MCLLQKSCVSTFVGTDMHNYHWASLANIGSKSSTIQLCNVSAVYSLFSRQTHLQSPSPVHTHVRSCEDLHKSRTFFPFLSAAFPFPLSSLPPPSGTGVATTVVDTGRGGSDRLWVSLSTCMCGGKGQGDSDMCQSSVSTHCHSDTRQQLVTVLTVQRHTSLVSHSPHCPVTHVTS